MMSSAHEAEWLATLFSDYDQFPVAEPEIRQLAEDCPIVFSDRIFVDWFWYGEVPLHPLHCACSVGEVSVETVNAIYRAFPTAISYKATRDELLPIHFAILNNCTARVVEYLAQKWPEGLHATAENAGMTPLHLACQHSEYEQGEEGSQEAVIAVLLRADSSVAMKRDFEDNTPLHHLCQNTGDENASLRSFQLLLHAAPQAASVRNQDDNLPLFYAVEDYLAPDRLQVLLEANPQAVDSDCLGRAWERVSSWDTRGLLMEYYASGTLELPREYAQRYPLHIALLCPLPSEDAFEECMQRFSTCASQLDERGHLPLHTALDSDMVYPSTVAKLAEREPRAVFVKDPNTGWYPFLAAAKRHKGENEGETASADWDMDVDGDLAADKVFLEEITKQMRAHRLDLIYRLLRVNPAKVCAIAM